MPKQETKKIKNKANYIPALGRRKRAVARIRLFRKKGDNLINSQSVDKYFPGKLNQLLFQAPLQQAEVLDKYHLTVKVNGSGPKSQLKAVVHGIARALVKLDNDKFRPLLKPHGFLTRDPRKRQRRQAGTGGKSRRQKQSPKR